MRIISKAVGAVAATAALTLTGLLAAPASAVQAPAGQAKAIQTDGYLDCDLYTYQAWGKGYRPGQAIVVTHFGFGFPEKESLVVKADGTWRTGSKRGVLADYWVEVHDTQGTLLQEKKEIGSCGPW
jgi:hypothetical protein